MYPFTKQLFEYNSSHQDDKIAMLILDVKGNYYKQIQKYANDEWKGKENEFYRVNKR